MKNQPLSKESYAFYEEEILKCPYCDFEIPEKIWLAFITKNPTIGKEDIAYCPQCDEPSPLEKFKRKEQHFFPLREGDPLIHDPQIKEKKVLGWLYHCPFLGINMRPAFAKPCSKCRYRDEHECKVEVE